MPAQWMRSTGGSRSDCSTSCGWLSFKADYWNVKIDDVIKEIGAQDLVDRSVGTDPRPISPGLSVSRNAAGVITRIDAGYANEGTLQIAEEQGRARNLTKTMAREWLDFARNAKRPTGDAFVLCVSAAGTDGFCADDAAVGTPE